MPSSEETLCSPGGVIQAIDLTSIQKITSGQVVVDLQTAVKELVENSLDAGATTIDVKFRDYGLESFEVSDNGSGIREEDLETVGLNHHTSKLSTFEDLAQVKTFGFRGEALSSLCALAKVTIQTASSTTEPRGWALEFDKMGKVVSKKVCSRPRGTTVNVQSLFHNLPVRRKQFSKECKKHFSQAQTLLQAYGLISTNLSLNVSNQLVKGSKTFQFQTKCNSNTKQNFSDIFTPKACALVIDLDLTFTVKPDRTVLRTLGAPVGDAYEGTTVSLKGLMSRPAHGQGRNSPDRQFYYINGRPFNPSKISKCVNEVYKQFNTSQYPVILANFILPPDSYDLNIDPNKRSIFLHSEPNLIEALREALGSFCQPYRSTFSLSQITSVSDNPAPPTLKMTLIQPTSSKRKHSTAQPSLQAPEIDPVDSSAKKCQSDDLSDATNQKKPKLVDIQTNSRDANMEIAPHDASTSAFSLFTTLGTPPLSDISPPGSPTLHRDEVLSINLGPNPHGVTSSTMMNEGPEGSQQTATLNSMSPEHNLNEPETTTDSDPSLVKECWVPSILRTDSSNGATGQRLQKTLDTSRASWNTKSSRSLSSRNVSSHKKKGISSTERMRNNIQQFIRGGHMKPMMSSTNEENDDEPINEHDQLSQADTEIGSSDNIDPQISEARATHESEETDHVVHEPLEEENHVTSGDEISHSVDAHPSKVCATHSSHAEDATASDCRSSNRHTRKVVREKEIIPSREPTVVKVPIDMEKITKVWKAHKRHHSSMDTRMKNRECPSLQGAGLDQSENEAETTLSRNVQKGDFEGMQIVGQFNLGFIIVRRRDQNNSEDDLFIVDQHASDEKFNFEKLQRETKLTGQRLLLPKVLDLTASEEITAMDNLDILEFNGFSVQIHETANVGQRVQLLAQPVSGNTSWDVSDLEELLHLIDERGSNEMVRPSKTTRMMASRACRMSTMIGDGLTSKQMSQIVKQMGTMDQPWACPHGRPTMRWLARCDENLRQSDTRYRLSDWIVGKIEH